MGWTSAEQWEADRPQREAAHRAYDRKLSEVVAPIVATLPKKQLEALRGARRSADDARSQLEVIQRELAEHLARPATELSAVREWALRRLELEGSVPIVQEVATTKQQEYERLLVEARRLLQTEWRTRTQAEDVALEQAERDAAAMIESARARRELIYEVGPRFEIWTPEGGA